MTLRRIAEACGGILHTNNGMENVEIDSIVTDSRQAGEGALFAAIKGERVDGHKFIPAVMEQGAVCVLSEQELPGDTKGSWIKVISTLQALKDIAEYYLKQLSIPVVGITGSVGKTSTKEMIAAVLSRKYRTLKTQGNFNNELGLPLTVFRIREEDEIAVLEMGISDFGEMHRLAKIARPDTCVITNIGQCHLEFLHSRDGILQAKTEIFDFLRPDGTIILNGNDDKLRTVQNVNGIAPVFFGLKMEHAGNSAGAAENAEHAGDGADAAENAEYAGDGAGAAENAKNPAVTGEKADLELSVWADCIESRGLKGISCRIHTLQGAFDVLVPIPGQHMVYNALAGTAVGLRYGLTLEQIKAGIESLQPVSGRFHIIETEDYTIIDDCYNANPVSMKASLEVLQDGNGRKVALLGDMGELGENEAALHGEVGSFAGTCRIDKVVAVGPLCRTLTEKAKEINPALETVHYDSLEELLKNLNQEVKTGDTILVKASHFMEFPKIVEALQKK